ncbi:hypothetical protein BC628DRAFT_728030 [Trametes gibbosa]|nr:hypothetical protein BC628DRAFT_728030 [Trametes gibbosa]
MSLICPIPGLGIPVLKVQVLPFESVIRANISVDWALVGDCTRRQNFLPSRLGVIRHVSLPTSPAIGTMRHAGILFRPNGRPSPLVIVRINPDPAPQPSAPVLISRNRRADKPTTLCVTGLVQSLSLLGAAGPRNSISGQIPFLLVGRRG